MSEENVELFYKAHDALNRRDFDALFALADPDVEIHPLLAGSVEGSGPYRGSDAVRSWWESFFDLAPDFSTEVEEARDLGDLTVARVRNRGHAMKSGAPFDQTTWQIAEWRHGKCVRLRTVLSEAEALEATGLSE